MGETSVLSRRDAPAVQRLLDLRPIDNIAIAAKINLYGVDRMRLGNDLIGYWENGRLISFLSNGFSLTPVNATEAALDAFAQRLEHRHCVSIIGVREEAMGLWQRLSLRSFTQWASPREVRDHQLVMAISNPPRVRSHPDVQVITTRNLDSYHAASVAMYTEEVGVAPMNPNGSYRDHVTHLMMLGLTYGVIQQGKVVFKADVVADTAGICQIGGVWLDQGLRHQGLSESFMAGVVSLCQERFPTVSLYVNPFNLAAIACYRGVGFVKVSECASILY